MHTKRTRLALLVVSILTSTCVKASAAPLCIIGDTQVAKQIRCTCYVQTGITASGQHTRKGIVAGKKEWIGRTCALYSIDSDGSVGQFIGYFEFLDTGAGIDTDGDGRGDSIANGTSIDVWQPSMEKAREFIAEYGDYVWLQMLGGEG